MTQDEKVIIFCYPRRVTTDLLDIYIKFNQEYTVIAQYWTNTTKYQPVPPNTDPVPPTKYKNQYCLVLNQYHQTIAVPYPAQYSASSLRNAQLSQLDLVILGFGQVVLNHHDSQTVNITSWLE